MTGLRATDPLFEVGLRFVVRVDGRAWDWVDSRAEAAAMVSRLYALGHRNILITEHAKEVGR